MRHTFLLIVIFAIVIPGIGQDSIPINRLGLNVEYGMGAVAVMDAYISNERYTGSIPYIGVWYSRLNEQKGFQLGLTNQDDSDLENYAIRANFSRVALNFDQFYRMKIFTMVKKPAIWYFGPSVEYFEYELINQFTSSHKMFSELIMVSMGINALLEWEFTEKFTASAFFRSNVIGVNSKTHDERQFPDKNSTLQTFVTANNINGDLFIRYRIIKRMSLGLKGKFQYTRSTGWNDSATFTNSLILFAIIHF